MATGSKQRAWIRWYRQHNDRSYQWPKRTVMGRRPARPPAPWWEEHPATTIAIERWMRRHCDGTCKGTYSCANLQRLTALRRAYRARR